VKYFIVFAGFPMKGQSSGWYRAF